MNDFDLVKEKNYYEIWNKYKALFMKFYTKLSDNKVYAFENFSDFYNSCYEVVIEAVDSIKLDKIKKPDTWTIYIQLYHYLQNYTTRKVVKDYYDNLNMLPYNSEILDESSYIDDHSVFEKIESLKAVISHLSEHDKMLLNKYIESGGKRSSSREAVLNKIRSMCK